MKSGPNGQSDLRAMRRRGSGVSERFGQNDDVRWQFGVRSLDRR